MQFYTILHRRRLIENVRGQCRYTLLLLFIFWKAELSLSRPLRNAGRGCTASTILNFSTIWSSLVSFTPRLLKPREVKQSSTRWIRGWLGPRASVEASEKTKISCQCRESKHYSSADQPVAQLLYWLRHSRISVLICDNNYYYRKLGYYNYFIVIFITIK
jgi:hypothetical protein